MLNRIRARMHSKLWCIHGHAGAGADSDELLEYSSLSGNHSSVKTDSMGYGPAAFAQALGGLLNPAIEVLRIGVAHEASST